MALTFYLPAIEGQFSISRKRQLFERRKLQNFVEFMWQASSWGNYHSSYKRQIYRGVLFMYDWHYQEAKITIMKGGYMRNFVYIYYGLSNCKLNGFRRKLETWQRVPKRSFVVKWICPIIFFTGCRLVKGGNL